MRSFAFAALLSAAVASAKQIVITVGGNTTDNATTVFQPAQVTADIGDTVVFNFTLGNHTAIQSVFTSPCVPAHDVNQTINGFNSGFRDAGNGTAITTLPVTISDNNTVWFYDANTCGEGGVGGININDTTGQTLVGFRNNAIRFNGTATTTASSAASTATSPTGTGSSGSTSTTTSASGGTSDADRAIAVGAAAVFPMLAAALLL